MFDLTISPLHRTEIRHVSPPLKFLKQIVCAFPEDYVVRATPKTRVILYYLVPLSSSRIKAEMLFYTYSSQYYRILRVSCSYRNDKEMIRAKSFKEFRHGFAHHEKCSLHFSRRRLQSVLIFSILDHPCFLMIFYYLFGVFLCQLTIIFRFPSI